MNILLTQISLPTNDLRASVDEESLDELADSLREFGQLQSVGVIRHSGTEYEVVYGARRTRAAKLLGWTYIDANIIEPEAENITAAKKLVENVHRLELSPTEEAYGLAALMTDDQTTIRDLRRRTGKSAAWIKSRLEILDMPEELQGHVHAGRLTLGVARELSEITNDTVRHQYVDFAITNGCTASTAKQWASQAHFAETGVMSMAQSEADNDAAISEPQFVETKYTCFICVQQKTYRQINTLAICGTCQEDVTSRRHDPSPRPLPPPIDTTTDLRDNATEDGI